MDGFKLQIMTFRREIYAFFYKNGPTLIISKHSVKMRIVQVTRNETINHNFFFIFSDLSSKTFYLAKGKIRR